MQRTEQQYFESAYAANPEAFGPSDGWYETRKRQVLLSSLSLPHYARGFEPGCGVGVLSGELATRCDHLLCMDWSDTALAHARQRVPGDHVDVRHGAVPEDWPTQEEFDLVVISELLYYLTEPHIKALSLLSFKSLHSRGGEVALVHGRFPSKDYGYTGTQAQRIFIASWPTTPWIRVAHEDTGFVLTVLGTQHA